MTPDQAILEIRTRDQAMPFKALNAAMDDPAAVIPELLMILDEVLEAPVAFAEDRDYSAHFHALFLLAQFREPRAFPRVAALLRLPEDIQDDLLGDLLTDGMDSLLASTCGGDAAALVDLGADPGLDSFARSAAMDALRILGLQEVISEARMLAAFATLFDRFEARGEAEDPTAWALLGDCVAEAQLWPLLPRLERAFAQGRVDPRILSQESVGKTMDLNRGHLRRRFLHGSHLVEDAILEFNRWHEWDGPRAGADEDQDDFKDEADWAPDSELVPEIAPETLTAVLARQGPLHAQPGQPSRNSPCPCGSGKKYKRCCGK